MSDLIGRLLAASGVSDNVCPIKSELAHIELVDSANGRSSRRHELQELAELHHS